MADSSFLGGARNKAGMPETAGLERQRIDEIIENASRGSKFYEHQQKREKGIREKIGKLTAKKAQMEKMFARDVDLLTKAQRETAQYISTLESERDLSRTIVCIDMDAFYAAVETLDRPELASVPMAVGGMSMLSTSNYEARKYGVVSAMPGYIALKLCPQLLLIPPNFDKYRAAADKFHQVFKRYDPQFSYFSLDEATLDLTQAVAETGQSPEEIVAQLRRAVLDLSGLTCSAGIAPNKMLAKVASNMNKPNGQFHLPGQYDAVMAFVRGTRVAKINGIGKVTAKILEGVLGVTTAEQLFQQRLWVRLLFSEIQANFLLRCSLGIGSTSCSDHESERQSMSTERTFPTVHRVEDMVSVLRDLCDELARQLELEGLGGRNVSIKMKTAAFTTSTRAITLKRFVWKPDDIFAQAKQLLVKHHPADLRLLGVRVSTLEATDLISPEESMQAFLVKADGEANAVKCPVCLKGIPGVTGSGSESSQRRVNDHVDLCLAKGFTEDQAPAPKPPQPDGRQAAAKRKAPTLDAFVRKAKK